MQNSQPIPDQVMEVLQSASTGMVMDALAMLGIDGGLPDIRPARGFEDAKIVGRASTMLFAQARPDVPKLTTYDLIEHFQAGTILVIEGKGMNRHWAGDNVGSFSKSKGLVGAVIWGCARDLAGWREAGMPVYCTGLATKDKPSNLRVVAGNVPVDIGDVTVRPGDIIVADEDGVVCVPIEAVEQLVEKMKILFEVEDGMQRAIKRGTTGAELSPIIAKKKVK